jgi:hypothetical protein
MTGELPQEPTRKELADIMFMRIPPDETPAPPPEQPQSNQEEPQEGEQQ